MQLNELIEQEGLNSISLNTNISEDNVKYLGDEDFEKLTRVKALGFLLILEREYKDLELSVLRENIKLFFEDHKPDIDNVIVMSKEPISSSRGGFSFFKWFIILGILFAAWYLYTQGNLDNLLKNIESKENAFDDSKALENNISSPEAEKVSVTADVKQPVTIEVLVAPIIEKPIVLSSDDNVTNNSSIEMNAIDQVVETVMTTDVLKDETNQSMVMNSEENLDVENNESVVLISTVSINPTRGMLWFGFINVDTKQRKEFMKKVSTPFDIQDGRWLLVTGHGFVDIISEYKTVEVADGVKHYFYIDSKEIRELTKQEFRDMNGQRGW